MPDYNWSEPESNGPWTYANEFGECLLEPVTEFMHVDKINRETVSEIDTVLVSLGTAERVTLITENRRARMSFCFPFLPDEMTTFALKYSCPNRAAVCRVTIQRFQTPNSLSAQEQIESMAAKSGSYLTLT